MQEDPKTRRVTIAGPARLWRSVGLAVIILFLLSGHALGWGQEGHTVIAGIAERHLTDKARERVRAILGADGSLASVANWADEVRRARPETAPWHYVNIPLNASTFDPARDCRNGDCITAVITHFVAVLRDSSTTSSAKGEALKFIVHFVGDLHQPLHCEDNNDKGGNQVQVSFFGLPTNLHSAWDTLIIQRIDPNGASYVDRLDKGIKDSDIAQWQQGTVEDWALESHALAQKVAYGLLPPGSTPDLGEDYFHSAAPVVDRQLQKAAIRLAYILNQALN